MKLARIGDIWKAVRRSRRQVVQRMSVAWSGIPRLTDGAITIVQPITLVCGESGAGKSSLLHTLFHAAVGESHASDFAPYCRAKVGSIDVVEIDIADGGGNVQTIATQSEIAEHFCPVEEASRIALVDAGMHVPALLDFIKRDANFADLLEGVDPIAFGEEELELCRFIVGRSYQNVSVFEIPDTPFGPVLPYFRVESQGVEYETPEMGYGEISVVYLLWMLSRIPQGSVLLIEEPETFLSPRAQTALVDAIAKYVNDRQLLVVMTSHSGPIAARLNMDEIIYTTRSNGNVVFHTPARTADLVARLGLVADRSFVFFVEDKAGEIFARALVDQFSDRLSGAVEYAICGGEGNVLRAIRALSFSFRRVAHVAVLDGDQRAAGAGNEANVVYLPGTSAPEDLLIGFAKTQDRDDLALVLGVTAGDVSRALAHADGDDLHNWVHTVARTLGMAYPDVLRRLVLAWAVHNGDAVREFVAEVERFSSAS